MLFLSFYLLFVSCAQKMPVTRYNYEDIILLLLLLLFIWDASCDFILPSARISRWWVLPFQIASVDI